MTEHTWIEAEICENCGEAAHVYFCPKPDHISKEEWQKMTSDEQYEATHKE